MINPKTVSITYIEILESGNVVSDRPVESTSLEGELSSLLNKHSAENGSNTPDFILAEYLMGCLTAFNTATKKAHEWRGVGYLNAGTDDT
jgi:hypothetical protein